MSALEQFVLGEMAVFFPLALWRLSQIARRKQ